MPEISQSTKKLIECYKSWHQSVKIPRGVSTIHVDEIASTVASFYEKIRGIVDWREEHLFRRTAIERILKRKFLLNGVDDQFAESLVRELIRGGHFKNDQVEEIKIIDVQKTIDKYIYILENSPAPPFKNKTKELQLPNWLLSIAACEIEEILSPLRRERALIEYMTELMIQRIRVKQGVLTVGGVMTEEEKNTQTYIAVQKTLFKLDSPIIIYHLIRKKYSSWSNLPSDQLEELAGNIYSVWDNFEKQLNHPLANKFYRICERYDTLYLLLGDILSEGNPQEISQKISDPSILEESIKRTYHARLSTLKSRLYRAATYSTLSIFFTNIFSLLILEIPLARLITGNFTPLTIVVDILGPTLLMLLLTISIAGPPKSNLGVVTMETMKIVYETKEPDLYEIKISRKRGFFTKLIITFLYLLGASVSLAAIYFIFKWANFPPTSVVVNAIFIALIAFAGLGIRNRAEELTVEESKGNILGFCFDVLFLPIAGLGRWLSNKWRKYNAIAVFFTALIDMPFQVFIEFLEQWRFFLKEKKEEIH